MLTGARIDSSDRTLTTTPTRPTQVFDVNNWLEATNPVRAFTANLCEYVPKHRAEVALES